MTSVYMFTRGGAFAEALRAATTGDGRVDDDGELVRRGYVYLDAFRTRSRASRAHRDDALDDVDVDAFRVRRAGLEATYADGASDACDERVAVDAVDAKDAGERDALDGIRRYSKEFMLGLRAKCVECPMDAREALEGAYPWRARDASVRAVASPAPPTSPPRAEDYVMIDGDVDLDTRSLWCAVANDGGDGESMFEKDLASAAETMRRMTSSSETTTTSMPTSSSMLVRFRGGAVRDFTQEIAHTHFNDFAPGTRRGEAALGILYGTRRRAANAKSMEVDVAFIHPWDGDLAHVLSWLGSQSNAELISPVGWVRANANAGLAIPLKTRRAYAESTLADSQSAARLFMTLDVVTSTYGALEMECYDLHNGKALEYFLSGDDLMILR